VPTKQSIMNMKHRNTDSDNKKLVVSSNDLVHAKYTFSLWQKRVFVYMVSEINSFDDLEFPIQKLYIKDLMNFFKVKNKDDYNVIQRIPEQLYAMSMKMSYRSDKGYKRWREVRILSQFTHPEDKEEDNAYIELKFNDDLKPHLLDLKQLFSQYDIQNIIYLRSVYSFKMYEWIKANAYLGKWDISLQDLKEMLDVEYKYKNYGSFKLKILSQAQNDLNECCDVTFTYTEQAVGKRVERLFFAIQKNVPTKGDGKPKTNKKPEKTLFTEGGVQAEATILVPISDSLMTVYYPKVKEFGISVKMMAAWIQAYSTAHIEACINDFLEKVKKGKLNITEPTQQGGYLRSLIEKADFSAKQKVAETQTIRSKQQALENQVETTRQDLKKQEALRILQKEQSIVARIFQEKPALEQTLFDDINRREGSTYSPMDYDKFPFLRSKMLMLLKKQFSEMF
jgi:plasmid replication initiation protein